MQPASPNTRTMGRTDTPRPRHAPEIIGTVAGVDYPLSLRNLSALDVGALRQQVGVTTRTISAAIIDGNADLDTIAVVVWLSRRTNGERELSYVDVAEAITFDDIEAGAGLRFAEDEPAVDDGEPLDPPA